MHGLKSFLLHHSLLFKVIYRRYNIGVNSNSRFNVLEKKVAAFASELSLSLSQLCRHFLQGSVFAAKISNQRTKYQIRELKGDDVCKKKKKKRFGVMTQQSLSAPPWALQAAATSPQSQNITLKNRLKL